MKRSLYLLLTFATIVFLPLIGCGKKHPHLVPVAGTVTIDGEPLSLGQVAVFPEGKRQAVGEIDEQGRFVLSSYERGDGVPIGKHLATVTAVESINSISNRWYAPMRYASSRRSDLQVTIEGPTDDLQVELTWSGSGQDGPYIDQF